MFHPAISRDHTSSKPRSALAWLRMFPATASGVLAVCLALPPHARAQSFIGLGDLPGGIFASGAGSVSNDGQTIAGGGTSDAGNEAYRWQNGNISGLGDLPGGTFSSTTMDISADGSTIVGLSNAQTSYEPSSVAFRWQNGIMTALPPFGAELLFSLAYSVSGDGQVIVGLSRDGTLADSWPTKGTVWRNGIPTLLDPFAVGFGGIYESSDPRPTAIDDSGTIIAGIRFISIPNSLETGIQGWILANGSYQLIGDLPGGKYNSQPQAISADGRTVVGLGTDNSSLGTEAFLWRDGVIAGLGDLDGGTFLSQAFAVSGDGTTIVGRGSDASGFQAVIWVNDGSPLKLSDYAAQFGIDLAGWTLLSATDISADGQWIVGSGINPEGFFEGFRLQLPDPSTRRHFSSGSSSSVSGNILNSATLTFSRADALEYTGTISGAGGVMVSGGGTLALMGQNQYTGTTTVTAGTLVLGHATNTLNDASTLVVNGGTLSLGGNSDTVNAVQLASGGITGTGTLTSATAFDLQSGSVTAKLGGSAGATKSGTGTVVLENDNTYVGTTTISGGILQLGAGGTTGSVAGDIANYGALVLDRSDSFTLTNVISGDGTFTKRGNGTLRLAHNQTLTGLTTIEAGALHLDGGALGAVRVAEGARLRGVGSVLGNLANEGVFTPGNSPGTVAISGNYTQASSGHLAMEIASPTVFDQLVVQGSASLGGTIEVLALPGFSPAAGQVYPLITAASLSGQFSSISIPISLPAALRVAPNYGPSSFSLGIQQLPYAGFAATPNQTALAAALDTAVAAGRMPELQARLNHYSTGTLVTEALAELSMLDHDRWHDAVLSGAEFIFRTVSGQSGLAKDRAWTQVNRREGDFDRDVSAQPASLRTSGIVAGYESRGVLGAFFAYEDINLRSDTRLEAQVYSVGLNGRFDNGPWQTVLVAQHGWSRQDSYRIIALPGASQAVTGSASARHWFAGVETSRLLVRGAWTITPSAGLHYFSRDQDGFTELGAATGGLRFASQGGRSLASRVGVKFSRSIRVGGATVVPSFQAHWRHEFRDAPRQISAQIGGENFAIQRPGADSNGWESGAQLTVLLRSNASIYLRYQREASTAIDSAGELSAGFGYQF